MHNHGGMEPVLTKKQKWAKSYSERRRSDPVLRERCKKYNKNYMRKKRLDPNYLRQERERANKRKNEKRIALIDCNDHNAVKIESCSNDTAEHAPNMCEKSNVLMKNALNAKQDLKEDKCLDNNSEIVASQLTNIQISDLLSSAYKILYDEKYF